jgi:catechol 2,3-dioxygenase-like lactoylglutathione lyase family enzyme
MFSHITLGTNDVARAEPFYDAVMGVLGHPVLFKSPDALAYGEPAGEKLFVVTPFDRKTPPSRRPAAPWWTRSTPPPWRMAARTRALRGCGRTIIRTTTALTFATPTATRSRPSAIAARGNET